jgi:hypothetical protein
MATDALTKADREMERAQARAIKEEARRLKDEQKELARQAAEAERRAAQAEVEAFESHLGELTGAHRVMPQFYNWSAQHFSLPPHPPVFHTKNHLREAVETALLTQEYEGLEGRLGVAWSKDEQWYYESYSAYEVRHGRWARLKTLAQELHAGDANAVVNAHAELEAQGFSHAGTEGLVLQPCDTRRLYVALRVAGRDITPGEVKTLTQSGKVAVKTMAKNRAREIYEDYVCSSCLAVARRLFGTLPVAEIIVTAYVPSLSAISGNETDVSIASVHFTKEKFGALHFDNLDPSDALQSFRHAGDMRASRRGEDFTPIRPLAFENVSQSESPAVEVQSLTAQIKALRAAFNKFQTKSNRTTATAPATSQE